ncbi:MAG: hypothetical protein E7508_07075 [Ruminococcus sp.]|nr:hypothetical protein [Ruminococcus sp.]
MNIHRNISRLINSMPEIVKQKLYGIVITALGILSAIASEEHGCYDITVAILLVPIGLLIVFSKYE